MFEVLDRQTRLTGNQKKILAAAIIGDALEFFDYFLIGFVLAFLIGPWKLTFGQSAVVLMSSGILSISSRSMESGSGVNRGSPATFGPRTSSTFLDLSGSSGFIVCLAFVADVARPWISG